MGLLNLFRSGKTKPPAGPRAGSPTGRARLSVETLESRISPSVTSVLSGTTLAVSAGPGREHVTITHPAASGQIVVSDARGEVGRFVSANVSGIAITTGDGDVLIQIDQAVVQPVGVILGNGNDVVYAGGGTTQVQGGTGRDKFFAGAGQGVFVSGGGRNFVTSGSGIDTFVGGTGKSTFFNVKPSDTIQAGAADQFFKGVDFSLTAAATPDQTLSAADVEQLLQRAAAATASDAAIVAIVDRGGHLLGTRVEGNVSSAVTNNPNTLTFAVDGALAEARTGAFFANNAAPLTSRTVQFISQSTNTQREVDSNPSITDPNSTVRGPGFVAPIGVGGHFPPGVSFTPQVDLFGIEATNRDSLTTPGPDGIKGTADDITIPNRFDVPNQYIPAIIPADERLVAPESYGAISGIEPNATARGIGTLPGGIPIYKNGALVGGIGVFFPGTTGYASEENSSLSADYNPNKPDLSLEAEYIAFAAVGGAPGIGLGVGTLGGVAPVSGVSFPLTQQNQRIDLVGITLNIVGPLGTQGPAAVLAYGKNLGTGNSASGADLPINSAGATLNSSTPVPDGWLVTPHDGGGLTAADVVRIVNQGIAQASITRAAIRLPRGSTTRMIFAVTDGSGDVLGLYRMPDATVFSLDVAVAKARNVAYYADANQLQAIDQVPGVPAGTAVTNRTIRFLAEPFFPEGIDGTPPGPFSVLNDGGSDPKTGLNVGAPLPASAFKSVQGHDAFNPETNFHDPYNLTNQNGIVFFPGSAPLYKNGQLVGGLGVSGDGVDQDDVVTSAAAVGYEPSGYIRADQTFVRNVRLPYNKFDRNPQAL